MKQTAIAKKLKKILKIGNNKSLQPSAIASLLANLSSVEISTAIVDEISGDEVFVPWQAYRDIYEISRFTLASTATHLSLYDRFLELRRELELAYALLLVDPASRLYNRAAVREVKQYLTQLTSKNVRDWENIPSKLPNPLLITKTNRLLKDRSFLQTLGQLYQAKLNLERRDRFLKDNSSSGEIVNTVYARTLIQLNGEIVNRYDKAIFAASDRENLLELHQQSVMAGQQQWRELLIFIASLCR
ncbi:hypothetical protein [Myxosarcina sp. GI1]|uniref:hypothetical protein n=1 Tax=Myxosarcina sp. GI1 TaxID=1541065 RepID=UPI000566D47C|nr:hypothetical protein [Myxosarcina sp. GI1]